MAALDPFSTAMYRANLPIVLLLTINVVYTQVTRPIGPFAQFDNRMDRLNIALNFVAAMLFQMVLILFLIAIAVALWVARRSGRPQSPAVAFSLAVIYLAGAACAVLLTLRPAPFGILTNLGMLIVLA